MNKIALITDSTCGLTKEYIDKYNVHMVNLKIIYKDKEYLDGINISPEDVYSRLDKEVPTTSMPSVQDTCNLYDRLVEEGYTHVIALPISSGLSGTINSFRLASEQYEEKIKSFVYDAKHVSMALGLIILEVGEMIKNNKTFEEICDILPTLKERVSMFFTVDTLEYLIKGGRIGKVAGSIGQLMNLKPIITMNDEGGYSNYAKVRGSKQSIKKILSILTDKLEKGKCKIVVMTGSMIEERDMVVNKLREHKNSAFIHSGIITPAIGVHSGPRMLAVGIMEEYLK